MLKRLKNFAGFIENINGLWLFIRIGVWIALVSIMLYLVPLPRLLKFLTPGKNSRRKWEREKLVNFVSFWLGRDMSFYSRSCLRRSLVLYRYFNLQGENAVFFIGVKREAGELKAHSWLMLNGEKLFPDEDLSYKIIYRYPEEEARTEPSEPCAD